jgi:predicted O-methyltransferase YrrM
LRSPVPQIELGCLVPPRLVEVIAQAAVVASADDLSAIADQFPLAEDRAYIRTWPGEHYRLLHGLGRVLEPALAIEVGTYRGAGTLVLSEVADRVITYDIVPIDDMPYAAVDAFHTRGGIEQRIGDLKDPAYFAQQESTLRDADFIFVDGPKDGTFEQAFLPRLAKVAKPGALLVLDDIRFACMEPLWRTLSLPRLDVGTLGHVSGTGVALIEG